jgi:hypothetical protein
MKIYQIIIEIDQFPTGHLSNQASKQTPHNQTSRVHKAPVRSDSEVVVVVVVVVYVFGLESSIPSLMYAI